MTCFLVLISMLIPCLAKAGEAEGDYWKDYALSYPQTAVKACSAPLDWETGDWLTAGGVVLAGGVLYAYDEELRDVFQRNRTDWGDDVMTVFKQFGEGKYVFPAILATALGGYLAGSDKTLDTGLLCLKSFILAEGVTQGLKIATQRQRPFKELGKEFWNEPELTFDRSFPSGHSTMAWCLAPIFAHQYKDSGWVGPTAYGIAALNSYSRLNDDKHWASDVFASAVIGYVSARLVLEDTPRLAVSPDPGLGGVSFRYEF
jgi:membrane-associated phospholipid phosphatase